jgi:hypothetical protein
VCNNLRKSEHVVGASTQFARMRRGMTKNPSIGKRHENMNKHGKRAQMERWRARHARHPYRARRAGWRRHYFGERDGETVETPFCLILV